MGYTGVRVRRGLLTIFIVLAAGVLSTAFAQTTQISLPEQSLSQSLKDLARQSGSNILFTPDSVKGIRAPELHGQLAVADALAKLLAATNLEAVPDGSGGLIVRRKVGKSDAGPQVESDATSQEKNKKENGLSEIVVTGSRIPVKVEGAQEVQVFTREQIDRSGQTTIADFLNTLPVVSTSSSENTLIGGIGGQSNIQLHGLPIGTTLILINGRSVQSNTFTGGAFDLNAIPATAVDRIEIVPVGSSAVYGSDAIAGVVNIILKKNFNGIEANVKYGATTEGGLDEKLANFAWGKDWSAGSLSVVVTYQKRGDLSGFARSYTADDDRRANGGPDARFTYCNPGNVYSADGANLTGLSGPSAGVPTGTSGLLTPQNFAATAGHLNTCGLYPWLSSIPASERGGAFITGSLEINPKVEVFTEIMVSHLKEEGGDLPPTLFTQPVPADNPFNPFKENVLVDYMITAIQRQEDVYSETFIRPLIGARGAFLDDWHWEATAWESRDSDSYVQQNYPIAQNITNALNSTNPATALNVFTSGAPGSPALLRTLTTTFDNASYVNELYSANAYVHGPAFKLPAGPVEFLLGAEYDHTKLFVNISQEPPATTYTRNSHAVFSEVRVPLLGDEQNKRGSTLAFTGSARYDTYSDFGGKFVPQAGLEWRPADPLLLRASYGESFRAPLLSELYIPGGTTLFQTVVTDPANGNQPTTVNSAFRGNPALRPETGQSYSGGAIYSDKSSGLEASITQWHIAERNSIQAIGAQTLVDFANLFPGAVIRGPGTNGAPGPITQVNQGYYNYGTITVAGVDLQVGYRIETEAGVFQPNIALTNTYHYVVGIAPGAPISDRLSQASEDWVFAPRWKGTAGLQWSHRDLSATVAGRYIGKYTDYEPLTNGSYLTLGNFWLFDANVSYAIGKAINPRNSRVAGTTLQLGVVNAFDRQPQFSNAFGGLIGYDPREADPRGRFVYANLRVTW